MKRHTLLLASCCVLGACAEESRLIRGCVREHGTITVEEYLQERGLTSCPDTPGSSCTGEILSVAAMECTARELDALEIRESQDQGNVQSGFAYTVVDSFRPATISYSSSPEFDDLIWGVELYEYGEDTHSRTRYFGARTGHRMPVWIYSYDLSTPF